MLRILPATAVLLGLFVLAAPIVGAQQTSPSVAPSPYRPGLGDLMTMTVQPRHIKLALAGRAKNWSYAAYEIHELQEAFERVARAWPQWRDNPIADLMTSVTRDPMRAMTRAIQHADGEEFDAAYRQLTTACNTCHQAAKIGVIAIVVPDATSFPDQDFGPAGR